MKTTNTSSIKALIHLLDNPSDLIFNQIRSTIIKLGAEIIPHLQSALKNSTNQLEVKRIKELLETLKLQQLQKRLKY